MIKWSLQNDIARAVNSAVVVSLAVTTSEGRSRYAVTAEGAFPEMLEGAVEDVTAQLRDATVLRGHSLPVAVTGPELAEAMRSPVLAQYSPRITEGEGLTIAPPSVLGERIADAEALGLRT